MVIAAIRNLGVGELFHANPACRLMVQRGATVSTEADSRARGLKPCLCWVPEGYVLRKLNKESN